MAVVVVVAAAAAADVADVAGVCLIDIEAVECWLNARIGLLVACFRG